MKDQVQVIVTFERHDKGLMLTHVTGPREACAVVDEAMRILAQYKILEARTGGLGIVHPWAKKGAAN